MQLDYMYRNGETRLGISLAKTLALNKSYTSEVTGKSFLVLEELKNFFSLHIHYKFSFLFYGKQGISRRLESTYYNTFADEATEFSFMGCIFFIF